MLRLETVLLYAYEIYVDKKKREYDVAGFFLVYHIE